MIDKSKVGTSVWVKSGQTGRMIATGHILTVSKTGKRVSVDYGLARPVDFYWVTSIETYVANPGAGVAGRVLNDRLEF